MAKAPRITSTMGNKPNRKTAKMPKKLLGNKIAGKPKTGLPIANTKLNPNKNSMNV